MRATQRPSWRDPETGFIREQISLASTDAAYEERVPEITRVTLPLKARVPFPRSAFEFISQAIRVLDGILHLVEGDRVHHVPCRLLQEKAAPYTRLFPG